MRRHLAVSVVAAALIWAAPATPQKKQKDPVLEQFLREEFGKLAKQIEEISTRVGALEAELTRLKQMNTDLAGDLRSAQTLLRGTDENVSKMSQDALRDLVDLKRDLAQLRNEVVNLATDLRRGVSAAPAAPQSNIPEGYITEVGDKEVTINLGSRHGLRQGLRLAVFLAADPREQIGVVEIRQILDANNSKAEIVYQKPGRRFAFSDIVRPLT